MWQHALSLLFSVHRTSRDYIRNTASYNGVISACGKGFAWRIAFSLLDDSATLPTLEHFMCHPTRHCRFCVLRVDLGLFISWWQLSHGKAKSSFIPDTISFNAALNACDKSSQWVVAIDILRRMHDDRVQVDVVD